MAAVGVGLSRSPAVPLTCCSLLQYLCCEVAALQTAGEISQLTVLTVAQTAWRLYTAEEAGAALETHKQVSIGVTQLAQLQVQG